ncbi:MAG: DNA mismatch repair protein MutS [Bacteroidota bacterium]|nr:DNA mismatch repair protein MutS [Bacteroidota bacterium]
MQSDSTKKVKSAKPGKEDTPLMRQYFAVKEKYPGALVLFRVGDFYETFGEDAIKASGILGITLTKRGNGSASEIELAGFPYHSLDTYLPKLVRAGQRVAVCDQLEDPRFVKGIVKRGVTELVTPGVVYNDNVLQTKRNNFLASIYIENEIIGISFLDISTGEFMCTQGNQAYIEKLIQGFMPSEIIFNRAHKSVIQTFTNDNFALFGLDEWVFSYDYTHELLTNQFGTNNLKGFGIDSLNAAIIASGSILHYLKSTEHHEVSHINNLSRIEEENFVWLDRFTIRNLELIYPQYEGGIPLVEVLDKTITPMGSRLLRKWLLMPLKDIITIQQRQNVVEQFCKFVDTGTEVGNYLDEIGDLERLISKVAAKRINPRELQQLRRSLSAIQPIIEAITKIKHPSTERFARLLLPCNELIDKITKELKPDVSIVINQGGLINKGVNVELDELLDIAHSGKDYLIQITQREIEKTGITTLKIQFNKVFGYYLEVTNSHKNKVPPEWIRKQTTVNGERYITEELKSYEDKILNAEEKIAVIEQRIFLELVHFAADYVAPIQQNAKIIGEIDCLLSFARNALKNNYVKPELSDSNVIEIKDGRHPVIEQNLPLGEKYIPNDVILNEEDQQIIIITGPNMAGKSALLRQTALIVLMAQIGSYVPASSVKLGMVDKIFTRVGASDNLSRGESTFMVEMTETASILNNLSNRSLILMDEIGRGTSTYDGISIAWAIVEHLHNHPKFRPKTLFATHYHELNELAKDMERVKNFNVSVKESGNKIIFMRKLKEGGAEHSFGIHVAQIAGMPNSVVFRSNEIMHELEKDKVKEKMGKKVKDIPKINYQMSIFEANDPKYLKIKEILDKTDVNIITPIDALLKINEMKSVFNSEKII